MPGFWRNCRTVFRWARYTLWLVVLLGLLAVAWVNIVGFPGWVKTPLLAAVQEHGVTVEFSRMRWRFIHGIVAENVIIGDLQVHGEKPQLTAGQIQLRLDYPALLHRKFKLDGVVVRDAIFTLPVTPTNRLTVLNIQAQVRFLPDETWSLDELSADFIGANIRLGGQLEHAPEAENWQLFGGRKTAGPGALAHSLQNLAHTLARIQFDRPPQISATLYGDARDVHSLRLLANADVPAVTTPWFAARQLQIAATLTEPAGAPTNFDAALDFWTNTLPFRLTWTTRAESLVWQDLDAGNVVCAGEWSAPKLTLTRLSGHFGGGTVNASVGLDVATRELELTNASAFDPHVLERFLPANVRNRLTDILWTQPPFLSLTGDFTLPAWTNRAPDWSEIITGPATRLNGELACTNSVWMGRRVELARTHFSYADQLWSAPDLQLNQDRTQLEFSGEESLATGNFCAALRGSLDAGTVRPFLPTNVSAILFALVKLPEPLALNFVAAGNLRNLGTLTATGQVALADVMIREQGFESAAADVYYTNHVLYFLHPHSVRGQGAQIMTADAVVLDWNAGMYFFTNGYSTTDPMAVVGAIGPKTSAMIAPYQFLVPPVARVSGQLPMRNMTNAHDLEGTDMTFDIIRGTPFRWTKLTSTNIMGTIHWRGPQLFLTNISGDFYGGHAAGNASFNFGPTNYACDFSCEVFAANVDVLQLGLDLTTNRSKLIEGRLTAHVAVTAANSMTWRSWNGYGSAELHDGLLWSIPIFGIVSPLLNHITPGLGNSRATSATVKFVMTNGVARSDLLEIQTVTMRLQYAGTLDLEANTDAHVTAQLLRNMPLIGSVISFVLSPVSKLFECQVTGNVSDPKVTPIWFPNALLMPLHPIRTLEEIMPSGDKP